MNAPKVIKVYGRPVRANLQGETIEREEVIYVPSFGSWFRTMDYDNHFTYRIKNRLGATLMCTCGGIAGLFDYPDYKHYQSTNMGKLLCCVSHAQTGRHADGAS